MMPVLETKGWNTLGTATHTAGGDVLVHWLVLEHVRVEGWVSRHTHDWSSSQKGGVGRGCTQVGV